MSPVGVIMDLILAGLLLAALWFGARLNRQLKTFQAGREAFARAVAELDQAAVRAHEALQGLRTQADESQDLLHGRILAARDLIQKLEQAHQRAGRAERDLSRSVSSARDVLTLDVPAPPMAPPSTRVAAPRPHLPERPVADDPLAGLTQAELMALLRKVRDEEAAPVLYPPQPPAHQDVRTRNPDFARRPMSQASIQPPREPQVPEASSGYQARRRGRIEDESLFAEPDLAPRPQRARPTSSSFRGED